MQLSRKDSCICYRYFQKILQLLFKLLFKLLKRKPIHQDGFFLAGAMRSQSVFIPLQARYMATMAEPILSI